MVDSVNYELVMRELQARLGQLVASYETELAMVRVEVSALLEVKDKEIAEKDDKIAALHAELAPKPPEAKK